MGTSVNPGTAIEHVKNGCALWLRSRDDFDLSRSIANDITEKLSEYDLRCMEIFSAQSPVTRAPATKEWRARRATVKSFVSKLTGG